LKSNHKVTITRFYSSKVCFPSSMFNFILHQILQLFFRIGRASLKLFIFTIQKLVVMDSLFLEIVSFLLSIFNFILHLIDTNVVFGVGRTLIEVIHHHYANTSCQEELMGPKTERVV
jgi:hypothetical protein